MKILCKLHHSKHEFCCVQVQLIGESDGDPARDAVPKSTQSNVLKYLRKMDESAIKQAPLKDSNAIYL